MPGVTDGERVEVNALSNSGSGTIHISQELVSHMQHMMPRRKLTVSFKGKARVRAYDKRGVMHQAIPVA